MDRAELSDAIVDDLGQLFADLLRQSLARLVESDFDGIEQCLQEVGRQLFGPVVERVVATVEAARQDERPNCPQCHQPMRLVDYHRKRDLQGLVGDYRIERAYYVCDRCARGYAPLDEHLGLGAGVLSPGLERVACRLGIDDSFGDAADALEETLKIKLANEAMRRVTEGIGQVAETEAQMAIILAQAGKDPLPPEAIEPTSLSSSSSSSLLVEVDGLMVHETDGQWHEAKIGLVAPLGPRVDEDKETGRKTLAMGHPSYCVGFESAESFWFRLYVEACREGLGTALVNLVVVLGDGAEWIWRYAPRFLALDGVKLIEIVDIYHAFSHLGEVANAVFGQGTQAAKEWLEPLKRKLEEQGAEPIVAALAKLNPNPNDPEAGEKIRKAIDYFSQNAPRMDYPRFVAMKLPIGSGAIESACKTLVQEREKGSGMRWSEAGAQEVATLRALHKSGRWKQFWDTHPQRRRPPVFPRRLPGSLTLSTQAKQAA